MEELRIFIRQPFTQSGSSEKEVIQGVLDVLRNMDGNPYKLITPTGFEAQTESTFRAAYEHIFGKAFTPQNFRMTRLENLKNADAMVVIRTGLSESGSFEIAFNIFGGRRVPMLFAVWDKAPIKTTLLQELQEIADTTYITFASPEELEAPLREFLDRAHRKRPAATAVRQGIADTAVKPPAHIASKVKPSAMPGAAGIVLAGHSDGITALCLLPNGRLASASHDHTVRLWDLGSGVEIAKFKGHRSPVNGLCLLSDGRLASASDDNTVRLWDTQSGAETACFPGYINGVWALYELPGGRLASVSGDNVVRIRDIADSGKVISLECRGRWVTSLCVLPEGGLASASGSHTSTDSSICLWDQASGSRTVGLKGQKGLIRALCSPSGGQLASGSDDGTIFLWNATTGAEIARLEGHSAGVTALCPLPSRRLASGSDDRSILVWDLNNGTVAARLEGHGAWVSVLCELSSGFLASASADGTVRLWETHNGAELACFEGHDALITALCPLPNAGFVSASVDGTVRLWRCAQSRPLGASEFKRRLRAYARKDVLISPLQRRRRLAKAIVARSEMPFHSSFSAVVDAPSIDEGSSAYGNFEGSQQLSAS